MCNVIILLNKPLEEDIPFTTRFLKQVDSGTVHTIKANMLPV